VTVPEQVPSSEPDWREAGERIDTLLDASSAGGVVARERSEELVRLVADLYGAGLERVLELMHERGHLDEETLDALAGDDLVASLLLVHGLHPYGVATRVEKALEGVRPYLGSHGGDVELLDVTDDGVVRLRLLGSCDGCASSSVTLKLAVEGAIQDAAPEISAIEVQTPTESASPVIPMNALFSRVSARGTGDAGSAWEQVPDLVDLPSGSVLHVTVGQTQVLACRAGSDLFAFVDKCARCEKALTGATVSRRLGGSADAAVLTCAGCRAHYDVRRAGSGLDDEGLHLDPLPLLADGVTVSIAVPAAVSA
jgi:Fe-S cluster biogenesis protein NfuA/nitrite reductase/ring-hydroxylating ferredoxin subunit